MHPYTAHVTPRDGIARRLDLTAPNLEAARTAAQRTAAALYRTGFTFSVRAA
jgi:hypothetical protein